jgi:hypothetical protein
MMSRIDSWHQQISTGLHFQNGHHNTVEVVCGIVVAILKMVTGRNFSMSGINSGHHYLPTYQILMISDNIEFLRVGFTIESYGKVEISFINVDNF